MKTTTYEALVALERHTGIIRIMLILLDETEVNFYAPWQNDLKGSFRSHLKGDILGHREELYPWIVFM